MFVPKIASSEVGSVFSHVEVLEIHTDTDFCFACLWGTFFMISYAHHSLHLYKSLPPSVFSKISISYSCLSYQCFRLFHSHLLHIRNLPLFLLFKCFSITNYGFSILLHVILPSGALPFFQFLFIPSFHSKISLSTR